MQDTICLHCCMGVQWHVSWKLKDNVRPNSLCVVLTFFRYLLSICVVWCKCPITVLVLLGCVINLIRTPTKEHRATMAEGGPQIIPCPGCSQAHQPTKGPLHKPQAAQGQDGRWEPKSKAPEERATLPWPSKGCPRGDPARVQHETHHQQPSGAPPVHTSN